MPYITAARKQQVKANAPLHSAGDLTYAMQQLVLHYLEKNGLTYKTLAEVMGAIEGLKFDVYRRVLAPYEEIKQRENGDVWPLELRHRLNGSV